MQPGSERRRPGSECSQNANRVLGKASSSMWLRHFLSQGNGRSKQPRQWAKQAGRTCQRVLPRLGQVLGDRFQQHAVLLLTQLTPLLGQGRLQGWRCRRREERRGPVGVARGAAQAAVLCAYSLFAGAGCGGRATEQGRMCAAGRPASSGGSTCVMAARCMEPSGFFTILMGLISTAAGSREDEHIMQWSSLDSGICGWLVQRAFLMGLISTARSQQVAYQG